MNTNSQQGIRKQFEAIVIGSGIAGLCYCLELAKLQPNASIALLCKTKLVESNSYHAQGGIAAANHQGDGVQLHREDTLKAGAQLNSPAATDNIIQAGQKAIGFLKAHGVEFDRGDDLNNTLALEGGHSERRIYRMGDQTGKGITDVLIASIKSLPNLHLFEHHTAINLITQETQTSPQVIGAYVLDEKHGVIHTYLAKAVILATGGAGKTYRFTSNPEVATGDGIAMAHRAGAKVENMEFIQFHPTLLYHLQCNNFLISEALRGEEAYLRRVTTGERFMKHYAPEQMELATRDIVARAIFNEIEHSDHSYVYLDIRHRDKGFLKAQFPNIFHTLLTFGFDLSKDLIPVVPAAHYLCGGVTTDTNGQTTLSRLLAIGETAYTGFHGANRLASNSLLECVVMAINAAHTSQDYLEHPLSKTQSINDWNSQSVTDERRASQINAHWRGLRGEMTSYAGIIRTERGLQDLLSLIQTRKAIIEEYYWKHTISRDFIELRNIVLVAEHIVTAALSRHESMGCHYREDGAGAPICST